MPKIAYKYSRVSCEKSKINSTSKSKYTKKRKKRRK